MLQKLSEPPQENERAYANYFRMSSIDTTTRRDVIGCNWTLQL